MDNDLRPTEGETFEQWEQRTTAERFRKLAVWAKITIYFAGAFVLYEVHELLHVSGTGFAAALFDLLAVGWAIGGIPLADRLVWRISA